MTGAEPLGPDSDVVAAVWITHEGGERPGAAGSILRAGDVSSFTDPSGLCITSRAFIGSRSEAGQWLDAASAEWMASQVAVSGDGDEPPSGPVGPAINVQPEDT